MLQQDQWHFLWWHSASNASCGAVPAGRAGDGASGPGFVAVPRPRQPHALWRPGGWRRAPARWAQGVLALTAFLLSGREQWKLSSRQHWWVCLVLPPPSSWCFLTYTEPVDNRKKICLHPLTLHESYKSKLQLPIYFRKPIITGNVWIIFEFKWWGYRIRL